MDVADALFRVLLQAALQEHEQRRREAAGMRVQSGSARTTAASVSVTSSPANARVPVSISNSTRRTPRCRRACRRPCRAPARAPCRPPCRGSCPSASCARRRERRRVRQRARRRARRAGRVHRLREAEVEHLHRAVGADLDVRGLQIAMDDALLVRGLERLGDLLARSAARRRAGSGRAR